MGERKNKPGLVQFGFSHRGLACVGLAWRLEGLVWRLGGFEIQKKVFCELLTLDPVDIMIRCWRFFRLWNPTPTAPGPGGHFAFPAPDRGICSWLTEGLGEMEAVKHLTQPTG